MSLAEVFKAYDIRGLYPEQLDEEGARRIGAAFVAFTQAPKVVIGRDMRESSVPLTQAFSEGATGQGADVLDAGLISTDGLYFGSGLYQIPGAMFTASHNPAQYNGIKMCLAGASPIGEQTGLAEIQLLAEKDLPPTGTRGAVSTVDLLAEFVQHLLGFVNLDSLRPLRVAVDAANGMAGKMVPALFAQLPFELIPLYFELDGSFPNHPADPIQIENLADLQAKVLSEQADIGLAFDGDADRVFLVDEKAEPISGSLTAALAAARTLVKHPGGLVVHNVVCSKIVPETILECGGTPLRTRVGHSFIKKIMADTDAVMGAEHSGHYYFRDNFRADSGMICALTILEALCEEKRPLSEIVRRYRRYWNSGEINTIVADPLLKMKEISGMHPEANLDWTDGLTVDYPDWWFNLRASNTEPLLRLNLEAKETDLGKAKTESLLELIKKD